MIVEGLAVGALIKTIHSVDKATKMDEKALKKYARAFEQAEEAELLVKQKADYTDKRLANVAKKKRAILEVTVPNFVDVYKQIQKIELEGTNKVNELVLSKDIHQLSVLNDLSLSVKKDFTDKELVCGLITKGLGKMIEKDSERYLSAANSQLRASNVVVEQSKSIAAVYDAIVERADRIAKLLMAMNALFTKSINETQNTIERNGLDVRKYNENDKAVLMTCVNIAVAMSDLIDIPVVDANGQICQEAVNMITTGEQFIAKMNQTINQY